MSTWKLEQAKDLSNKNVIVTGANTGLGFETTKAMVKKNANVIMACRSSKRAEEAKLKILEDYPNASIDILLLDLGDLSTIDAFVKAYKEKYNTLDILINNAGVMTTPYMKTSDGFEFQNGINHLGHFALTAKLFDLLKTTKNARIVIVSSIAHKGGQMHFEDYMFEDKTKYTPMKSYSQSKLSNLLFMDELNRKLSKKDHDVTVVAAHPGVSRTELTRYILKGFLAILALPIMLIFTQSAKKGALPQLRAALDEDVKSGDYYGPSGFKEMRGKAVLVSPKPHAKNAEDAKKLWELSEQYTNTSFNI
jgi:NAD(P)-dependent dehydrogenase (short-subunit alcohol dehydrogenase family)